MLKEGIMNIAECLKKLRAQRGWTQGAVCRATGLERSAVSRLESGRAKDMSVRTAMKLAHAFGLSVEEFWLICQNHDGGPRGKEKGADEERGRE